MRIYIAGPMYREGNEDTFQPPWKVWQRITEAVQIALRLHRKGHAVYVPHLNALVDILVPEHSIELMDMVYNWDYPWLEVCDAIFYIGSSPGADVELEYAKKLGLKVYTDIRDVPDLTKNWDDIPFTT